MNTENIAIQHDINSRVNTLLSDAYNFTDPVADKIDLDSVSGLRSFKDDVETPS
ncbi:hypothetical protein PBCVAN69C_182L [Paramecium bursaria Chlorella virus AN69C]|uniref:Uncharacterized protein n=1 Tax=Paramecium bursaria Chlorella virus IL3A TaxID=46019 RepID=M1HUD5_PBCVI|nr:hypothetical protein PBCVAN69C_182L [Paramecium bursaria Chlorella virus AN69C]AGE53799.1 hypothetical protein PBCVIL3A_178L [Paramecium bursaria Chlorella virus IL3A]AGE57229.1 hypothetical protein PBCVNEJV4_188L [Paramecium bursaria Chlorella virus NE-JV-4]